MAETAKQRKRVKRTFFEDSDDDFSELTPPPPSIEGSKKKLKKKKKYEKPVAYTSTQVEVAPRTTRNRGSPDEKRFQQELEEALKLSVDETCSSIEFSSTGSQPSSIQSSSEHHGPSSADTVILEENLDSTEKEKSEKESSERVVREISEKEMLVENKDSKAAENFTKKVDDDDEKDFCDEVKPVSVEVKKIDSKAVKIKKKKDGWILNPDVPGEKPRVPHQNLVSVVAEIHRNAGDDGSETEDPKEIKPAKVKRLSGERKPQRQEAVADSSTTSPVAVTDSVKLPRHAAVVDEDDIKVMSPVPVPEQEEDLPRKRKRKARIIESDSDSDFGDAEIKSDNSGDEYQAQESEDEFIPASKKKAEQKKKSPNNTKKKKTAETKPSAKLVSKEATSSPAAAAAPASTELPGCESPLPSRTSSPRKPRVPVQSHPISPKPLSPRPTNVPDPVKPEPTLTKLVKPSSKALTPVQAKMKPILGNSFSQVKVPAWTPPAKIAGNRLSSSTPQSGANLSPAIGLRLGLSRNMRVSKPLHTSVKKAD